MQKNASSMWQDWSKHQLYALWHAQHACFMQCFHRHLPQGMHHEILHANPYLAALYQAPLIGKIHMTASVGLHEYLNPLTPPACFSGIYLPHVLENTSEYTAHLDMAIHLLKPGGILALMSFNAWSLWRFYAYIKRLSFPVMYAYPHYYGVQHYAAQRDLRMLHAQFGGYNLPTLTWPLDAIGDRWLAHGGGVYYIILQRNDFATKKFNFRTRKISSYLPSIAKAAQEITRS